MALRSILLVLTAASVLSAAPSSDVISLAGTWAVRMDPDRTAAELGWPLERFSGDTMFLPGSTDEAGYGVRTAGAARGHLSRPYVYEGPAWYQRDITIPETWRGKRITLSLERPHWETSAWIDGKPLGVQNSLATPHMYDLGTSLLPGRHRLTICVDNTYKIDVGRNAHSMTDHTQTNWNGIVGRIELRASGNAWIDGVRLFPDAAQRRLRIEVFIRNLTGKPLVEKLTARIPGSATKPAEAVVSAPGGEERVELSLSLARDIEPWDEYEGRTFPVELRLGSDTATSEFGLRDFAARGRRFVLNGRPIFLRGTLECNIFPKTGYPPTDVESWARLFRIARSYGLNHFRFHSWCPPEAAFTAADRAGFLLHVELPVWSQVGRDPKLAPFMRAEARRILAAYGNHPSFAMLCLGNELTGDYGDMDAMVSELKALDPRRLYTFAADHRRRAWGTSDYYVTHHTVVGPVRIHGSRFAKTAGSTDYDFSEHVAKVTVPLVAHELGQWAVFPDYSEIAGYTGVLKPRNLEVFREQLDERGMGDQNRAIQAASGRFAWELYKEDVETALRTPDFGGVQLLSLQDFPGQGEALVGMIDSFWESKGIRSPEEFRQFFGPTVPLARFAKFVWKNNETFEASVQVAHYGKTAIQNAVVEWSLQDAEGRVAGKGAFPKATLALGAVTPLGRISQSLARVDRASRLTLTVSVAGQDAKNSWNVWVYPAAVPTSVPAGITVARSFDAEVKNRLAGGSKVLLLWPRGASGPRTLPTRFLPVFWSLSWFKQQPGTLGILCDPKHPALEEFPTAAHSQWQWWELTEGAQVFVLDDTPAAFRPIVQVIDDYHRNHKLGAVFETAVGKGKLLVSSLDLESDLENRPVARELRRSLLDYMAGAAFSPSAGLGSETLVRILAPAR